MADFTVTGDTRLDARGFSNGLSKLKSAASTGLKALTASFSAAVGAMAVTGLNYNKQMETYTTNFEVMLGSAEAAAQKMQEISSMAASTPFELADLANATQTLLAFNVASEDSSKVLGQLGDISLGSTEKLGSLTRAYGKMNAAQKVTLEDINMMIDAGYNPLLNIQDKTGESMSQLYDRISAGEVAFSEIQDAIAAATSEGGQFYQGMEKASQTTEGLVSTLQDVIKTKAGEFFQGVSDKIKELLPQAIAFIENIDVSSVMGSLKNLLDTFTQLAPVIAGVAAGVKTFQASFLIAGAINKASTALQAFQKAQNASTLAQAALNAVMKANPLVMIITLIVTLTTALITLFATNESFREGVIAVWNAIGEAFHTVWDAIVLFFTETLPAAWNAVVEWFNQIPDWWNGIWSQVGQFFAQAWAGIIALFTETIPSLVTGAVEWFGSLPEKIGYAIGLMLGKLVGFGADAWAWVTTELPTIIQGIVDWFAKLPGRIWEWLVSVVERVIDWGSNLLNTAVSWVSETFTSVVDWFQKLPSRIWEWLQETVSKVVEWGGDLVEKGVEAAQQLVDDIVTKIKKLPGEMLQIGKDIVTGIWDGITGMASWLGEQISGFVNGIVEGFKAAFDSHSPSRRMRDEVGKTIPQGVAVGIEADTSKVRTAMEQLIGQGYQAVMGAQGLAASAQRSLRPALAVAGAAPGTSGSGSTVIYQTNHYTATIDAKSVREWNDVVKVFQRHEAVVRQGYRR